MSEHAAGPSGTPKPSPSSAQAGPGSPSSGQAEPGSPSSGQAEPGSGVRDDRRRDDGWVSGGVVFAGVLLLCAGVLSVLLGITAAAEDDVYALMASYVYKFDLTSWGVIHIVIGALAAVTGVSLLMGMDWARYVGILLAALSLVAQFLFLPYAPFWAVVVMAIDVFIIWALAVRAPLEQARH